MDVKPENEQQWAGVIMNLARFLRSPEGCPWDRKQKSLDFANYLLEEVQELIEAVQSGDAEHAEEEWGDVFFVLMAAAAAAESESMFTIESALQHAHDKMIRRHEHVFGDKKAVSSEDAITRWNDVKAREKKRQKKPHA